MTWLVTGTDTEIGKTVVTACIAAAARTAGHAPRAVKPLATGVGPGEISEDAALLALGAGHEPCTYATFGPPVSPHRAAWLEDRHVNPEALLAWVRAQRGAPLFIEGIGGWKVPWIAERDGRVVLGHAAIARAAGARVIVVAPNRLGVLNHTLLTVEAIRHEGLQPRAVVLNDGAPRDPADASGATNEEDLRLLLDVPVVRLPPANLTDPASMARAGHRAWMEIRETTP